MEGRTTVSYIDLCESEGEDEKDKEEVEHHEEERREHDRQHMSNVGTTAAAAKTEGGRLRLPPGLWQPQPPAPTAQFSSSSFSSSSGHSSSDEQTWMAHHHHQQQHQYEQEQEQRLRYDKTRGLFLDVYTNLHYDYASNLYYNLTSGEQTSLCYHWDPSVARFLPVMVDRIVRFPATTTSADFSSSSSSSASSSSPSSVVSSYATENTSQSSLPSSGLIVRHDENIEADASEREEGELNDEEANRWRSEDGERNAAEEEEEEEEGDEEDEEAEKDRLAESVRRRGLEERQSWSHEVMKDWRWDQTSCCYYDSNTGLYYSPASDLYLDYNAYPAASYHRLSREEYVEVQQEGQVEEQAEEALPTEEEAGMPSKLLLTLSLVEDDTQVLGSYVIGDVERDSKTHPNDTASQKVFTIGRDRKNDIRLMDLVASKCHARITWQNLYWQNFYWLQDLGSNNGTFLNGQRLSESRAASGEQECPLQLNDHIIIGNIKLVVGRAVEKPSVQLPPEAKTIEPSRAERSDGDKSIFTSTFQPNLNHPIFHRLRDHILEEEHRSRRQSLKRKLCHTFSKEERESRKRVQEQYIDRTARRQDLYQSSKRYYGPEPRRTASDDVEQNQQPQLVSVAVPAPIQENKGKNLLKKMGWTEGEGLGRDNAGIVEPIQASMSNFSDTTRGLGFGGPPSASASAVAASGNSRDARWGKARERYHKLFNS